MSEITQTGGYLDVVDATLRAPRLEATSNIGIANTNPQHAFSVGSNLYVSTDSSDVLTVDGNVVCEGVKVGLIEITPSYDLAAVSNVGNVTQSTIQFSNATTGFVTTANIEVGTANLFVDTTTGNVGIGKTDPGATLEVYGDPSNGGNEATLQLVSNTANTISTSFTSLTSNAGVFTIQSGTAGTADSKGDIAFSSVGGDTEHMRIQGSTGNVGIGTTDPGNSLHVYKAAAEGTSGLFIEKASGGAGTTAALFFGVTATSETTNTGIPKAAIFYERTQPNGRGDIKFCNDEIDDTNAVTTADADTRMIIKNDGKVGISNPSPYHTLDVIGNFRATQSLGLGGAGNARPIRLTKVTTSVNNYSSVDFFFTNISGGWNPFIIEAYGYSINVSGVTNPISRRLSRMYAVSNDSSTLVTGTNQEDDGFMSVTFTNSTKRVRITHTDLRSYSGIYATITSFSGVI